MDSLFDQILCPWHNIDIFDMHNEMLVNHVFLAKFPNYISIHQYINQFINSVINKNPKMIICDHKIYPYIEYPYKISLSDLEIDQIIHLKYNKLPKKIIGITGSFGKSSTAFFLYQFLKQLGYKTFLSSSLGIGMHKLQHSSLSCNTNLALKRNLHQYCDCDFAILEVTSHAIDQNRIKDIPFFGCIFSGFIEDHLDYHQNLEHYLNTKLKFINSIQGIKVIHNSVPIQTSLNNIYPKEDIVANNDHIIIKDHKIFLKQLNTINRENILGALYFMYKMNLPINQLNNMSIINPQGRFELVGTTVYGANVYNDGAHSKEQVKLLLSKLSLSPRTTYLIYGAAYYRLNTDVQTGKILGYFGKGIVTDDDPYTIKPEIIRNNILSLDQNLMEIPNRFEAIKYCLEQAKKNDNIIVLGKGSEVNINKIRYHNYTIYYEESKIIKQLIQNQILNLATKSI